MESQREGSCQRSTQHLAQLIEAIGGKENITTVSHCLTRLRFVLADPAKADPKAIETIPSVKGSFTQGGQFQVVIGNEVDQWYCCAHPDRRERWRRRPPNRPPATT